MSIDSLDGGIVGDRNMLRCDTHHLAILLMRFVDGQVTFSLSCLKQQPKIGETRESWAGDAPQVRILQVRQQVIRSQESESDERSICQ